MSRRDQKPNESKGIAETVAGDVSAALAKSVDAAIAGAGASTPHVPAPPSVDASTSTETGAKPPTDETKPQDDEVKLDPQAGEAAGIEDIDQLKKNVEAQRAKEPVTVMVMGEDIGFDDLGDIV